MMGILGSSFDGEKGVTRTGMEAWKGGRDVSPINADSVKGFGRLLKSIKGTKQGKLFCGSGAASGTAFGMASGAAIAAEMKTARTAGATLLKMCMMASTKEAGVFTS